MQITTDDIGTWFRTRHDGCVIITHIDNEANEYPVKGRLLMAPGAAMSISTAANGVYNHYSMAPIGGNLDLVSRITDPVKIAKLELIYETYKG